MSEAPAAPVVNNELQQRMVFIALENRSEFLGDELADALIYALTGPGHFPAGPAKNALLNKPDEGEELDIAKERADQLERVLPEIASRIAKGVTEPIATLALGFNILTSCGNLLLAKNADVERSAAPWCQLIPAARQRVRVAGAHLIAHFFTASPATVTKQAMRTLFIQNRLIPLLQASSHDCEDAASSVRWMGAALQFTDVATPLVYIFGTAVRQPDGKLSDALYELMALRLWHLCCGESTSLGVLVAQRRLSLLSLAFWSLAALPSAAVEKAFTFTPRPLALRNALGALLTAIAGTLNRPPTDLFFSVTCADMRATLVAFGQKMLGLVASPSVDAASEGAAYAQYVYSRDIVDWLAAGDAVMCVSAVGLPVASQLIGASLTELQSAARDAAARISALPRPATPPEVVADTHIRLELAIDALEKFEELPEGHVDACGQCNAPIQAQSLCARCKAISYCSTDCQKDHWEMHKKVCKHISSMFAGAGAENEPSK